MKWFLRVQKASAASELYLNRCESGQWSSQATVVMDEAPVKFGETYGTLKLFAGLRLRPIHHGFDLVWVHGDVSSSNDLSQKQGR